jgi:hypothetical protein
LSAAGTNRSHVFQQSAAAPTAPAGPR